MSCFAPATERLAPDPALPARDVLLDDAEVLRIVRRLVGRTAQVTECRRVKAKYRIGASLRVLYRVRAEGEERLLAARMFAPGRAAESESEALAHAVASGPLPSVLRDEGLETVFWAFPNDRKIRGLESLADPRIGRGVPGLRAWSWTRTEYQSQPITEIHRAWVAQRPHIV